MRFHHLNVGLRSTKYQAIRILIFYFVFKKTIKKAPAPPNTYLKQGNRRAYQAPSANEREGEDRREQILALIYIRSVFYCLLTWIAVVLPLPDFLRTLKDDIDP